jgi:hypothetical protein
MLLFFINSIICCKKQEVNSVEKDIINEKSNLKEIEQDILPTAIIEKYKLKKYFNRIVKNDIPLLKDISRIYKNKTGIEYKEIKLDKYLTLCQFIFQEEVQYDYYYKSEKLIYREITPLNKAHFNFEYKDWNGDKKPEIITNYEQSEGGGGLAYYKTKSIYETQDDTIMKIVSLPIENITCQLGEVASIEEYQYQFKSKTNELTIKKTTGSGDCNSNKIKTIKSKKSKTVLLKKYNNSIIIFD